VARRWAARDLGAHEGVSEELLRRLAEEPDRSVREVIFTTLTQQRDPVAVRGLVAFLRSEDPAVRSEAVETMKQLPDQVAPLMGELLADPDPDVRIFAVNILESLRHPSVERWLVQVIENDSHLNVCGAALDLLTETGTVQAVAAILRLKHRFSTEPYIQFSADLALQRIGKV
jgi:HEAT repeat protein